MFSFSSDIERKAEELPYHLESSGNKEKLKQALLEQDMFNQMYKDNNKQQLMKYWRFIGGYELAATCYIKSLEKFISVRIQYKPIYDHSISSVIRLR